MLETLRGAPNALKQHHFPKPSARDGGAGPPTYRSRAQCRRWDDYCGLQPYQGGNEALWALNKLSNTDKYRILCPFGTDVIRTGAAVKGPGYFSIPDPHKWDSAKNEMEIIRLTRYNLRKQESGDARRSQKAGRLHGTGYRCPRSAGRSVLLLPFWCPCVVDCGCHRAICGAQVLANAVQRAAALRIRPSFSCSSPLRSSSVRRPSRSRWAKTSGRTE